MKHIKRYENILKDNLKKQKDIKKEKKDIIPLIDKYIRLHKKEWDKWGIMDNYVRVEDFHLGDKDNSICEIEVSYFYKNKGENDYYKDYWCVQKEQLKDLLFFIDHPNEYLDIKKYNL